jgi:radical SAM/Cys-rich protein
MHATFPLLQHTTFPAIRRRRLETLQVNVGYKCNQSCLHCHVNAGPNRKEMMQRETVDLVLRFLRVAGVRHLDVTGGAPELNEHFRHLVSGAHALGVHVIDRCNLTVLELPGQEDTGAFLAAHGVEVTASLPCYLEDNVNRQRGEGVFQSSIRMLRKLNELGYARPGSGLTLNLVYNPQGPTLPPAQAKLEQDYKKYLGEQHGISFDHLFTLANMPIQRFGSTLVSKGQFGPYMRLLKDSHRDDNLETVMCRSLLSVDWQGTLYDCDFNQMLHLPLRRGGRPRVNLAELIGQDLEGNAIVVADHCFGCTAGQGSSCGGALA